MVVNKVVPLPKEDSGTNRSIARLNNKQMDSSRTDRSRFFRREPLLIINLKSGARVLRYAMGNPGSISIGHKEIALDYDGCDGLGIKSNASVTLIVRRAKPWEVYKYFWGHPDMNIQLSSKLGMTGAVLGLLGFVIGVAGLL